MVPHIKIKNYILIENFDKEELTNNELLKFIEDNSELIELNWVENIGPYRKLLPLLKEKWNEDKDDLPF